MRNRLLNSFALFALLATVFVGCKEEPTYTVQVTATEGGTVEGQNGEYKEGETIVFTAIPADGYYFSKWSDGDTDNPRTITVSNENVNMEALFLAAIVDLGLESGTLWATRNLGATAPCNYGDYFAWGETETKNYFDWSTYKHSKGRSWSPSYSLNLTKYCSDAELGFNGYTDELITLLPEDDAATAVLGPDYSMPIDADWQELCNQCYWVWTENYNNQNVSGYIVYKVKSAGDKGVKVFSDGTPSASYSLSDAHIFLPVAGYYSDSGLQRLDSYGAYWSASIRKYPDTANFCGFYDVSVAPSISYCRYYGLSVRPVRRK